MRVARYLQLDDTNLAYLCDEKMREGGAQARRRSQRAAAPVRPPDQCRDRRAEACRHDGLPCTCVAAISRARGWREGGYEPVAEVLFNGDSAVDGYFLEYDDARSGDFKPLRFLPKGKTVVLGLVTTKLGQLESKDDLKRRIDEAAKYVPLEQLCLSPQCGFSSTVHGNDIAVEAQRAKLRLIVEVADEVWGGH